MTNPLHVAESVGDEIAARLATCTVALDAETDLGVKVYRGRRRIDDSMIPCVTIIEGDDIPARATGGRCVVKLDQRYVLYAYVPCDPDDPNVAAHAALRDMKRALFSTAGRPDNRLGGKVFEVEYLGRDIGPRADGAALVLAALEIGVTYVEDLAAP